MDLDQFKTTWNNYDEKLNASLQLNRKLLREITVNKVDAALRRHSRNVIIELVFDFVLLLWLGSFIGEHLDTWQFALPALVLHIFVILLASPAISQLVLLYSINYAAPILTIQKQVEQLRVLQIRLEKWPLLLAPFLWVPIVIVGAKGLFAINMYTFWEPIQIVVNVLFGLAFIPVMWLVARYLSQYLPDWAWLQRFRDDLLGRNLVAATGFLQEIKRFEREDGA
jgi:hypothetical protein